MRIITEWQATVAGDETVVAVTYTAPCCNTVYEINVQAPTADAPTDTELWCHRDGRGAPASVVLD